MGTTKWSIETLDKYAVFAALEYNSEALFDDRLYAIRWNPRLGGLEAVYMPDTPVEESLGESIDRTDLANDIARHVERRRYEAKLAEVATPVARVARIVADLNALAATGMSMDMAGQIAYAMADVEPLNLILGALLESRLESPPHVPCDNACGAWGEPGIEGGFICDRCRESGE